MRGALFALLACIFAVSVGAAQDEQLLIRMLHDGQTFKVRARAAMALGHADAVLARPALERALADRHPLVRMSAARALGELGDTRALPALRELARREPASVQKAAREAIAMLVERQPTALAALEPLPVQAPSSVAWHRIRYAVVVGEMRNQSGDADKALAPLLGQRVTEALARMRKVAVFSAAQLDGGLESDLERHKLQRFRMEGVLNDVRRGANQGQLSVRCEVSLLLLDEPARNLRSVLKGAATGVEPPMRVSAAGVQDRRLTHRALDGAVKSALSDAWATLEGAARGGTATRKSL